MKSVSERSISVGPCSKIQTAQGTNQNASFHRGPVRPYDKRNVEINLKLRLKQTDSVSVQNFSQSLAIFWAHPRYKNL